MAKPSFATPLPQSNRSEVLEWRFPKPFNQYILTGKSRAAWHTSFVIPQLNLLLDAGLCVNKARPKHVFLTHGHNDHVLLAPAFVKREDPPDIFCPAEMKSVFNAYIFANSVLNLGGLVGPHAPDGKGAESDGEGAEQAGESAGSTETSWLAETHVTHGLRPGDVVPLRRLKNIYATAFACDHTVPCLGYVFSSVSHKLKPEYAALPGLEIKALREAGVEITAPHSTPFLAFLGDTTAETLLAEPEWLREGILVVITECSFLYPEHESQAAKTKHTSWSDLERVVRKWPRTTFVLMHFSLRYSDEEVRRFFKDMKDPPGNILVWVDGLDGE
ncbi:uncharacterized protein DNG_06742 [Cephalotrichum gorgonifer]|uniref:Metallo-beta-lactamase domain-containing protein n=1 Tax=Cephalotrichum gorgonifer TaxID=2041049 RepID=A0AAE8N263_9PEZI|nr:uncharacterized protein DNG_06742 [Cephalotrichum gorgonifer]